MKKARKILNIIVIILLVCQLLGYLGNINNKQLNPKGVNLIAFYIGFNLPLILAAIIFLISLILKSSIVKNDSDNLIDSIGQS